METEQIKEKIEKSSNMVSIRHIILSDIWSDFAVKFANEYRPFNRVNEVQQNWIDDVNATYVNEIIEKRKELFSLIPSRFFNTIMYKKLNQEIN
jgi:hypothetical protein